VGEADTEPRPSAVSFVTTEHFALQSARAATIAESIGRATAFLASISGGLIALGLVATAGHLGTAFYAFGLVILPTLAFVGLVTFERALQSAMDDHLLARRIALLRGYYLDNAPELARYLVSSTTPTDRLRVQGLLGSRRQALRTVAGMVAVITAVLAGSAASLIALLASNHSLLGALLSGAFVALAALGVLMRFQNSALKQAGSTPLIGDDESAARTVLAENERVGTMRAGRQSGNTNE
jgi:hypothetical protein